MATTGSSGSPSHAQLRYAMYEYLQSVIKSGGLSEEQTEGLEVAAQCMSEAFGFSTEDTNGAQHELSLKPLTLPVIFNTGVQVLSGSASGSGSPVKSPAPAPAAAVGVKGADGANSRNSEGDNVSEDESLFKKFLATLTDRGFFAGLTEGTPEWAEREGKARTKFNQRYSKSASADPASSGAQDKDKQLAAQEELRQRLALETKRMEDAEVIAAACDYGDLGLESLCYV